VVGNFADAAVAEDDKELERSRRLGAELELELLLTEMGSLGGVDLHSEEDPMSAAPLSPVPIPSPANLRRGSLFEYQSLSGERM